MRFLIFLLFFCWCGCAQDKHALQVGVTCRYPSGPEFDQRSHGRVSRTGYEEALLYGLTLPDVWRMPDGGVEIR